MKRFITLSAICVIVLSQVGLVTTAQDAKKPAPKKALKTAGQPQSFPAVSLSAGSDPRYAVFAVDPWKSKIAYVVFDGNVSAGYGKIYVWIPDDPKYGRPVLLNTTDGKNFAPFSYTSSQGGEKASLSWRLGWTRGISGGGTHKHRNYTTGEVTTSTSERRTYSVFSFGVHYGRGPGAGSSGSAQASTEKFPLDVNINGRLTTYKEWEQLPQPLAPWYSLLFSMPIKPFPDRGQVHLKGRLSYAHYNHGCTVRSLPQGAEISLAVSPYLESPVYSNMVSGVEAFDTGVELNLPYGWYYFRWNMTCPGLGVRPSHHYANHGYIPYAFPKPVVAASGG